MILQYYPGAFTYREICQANAKFIDYWFIQACGIMISGRIEKFNIHGGSEQERARIEFLSENIGNLKIMENNLLRGF